jgi:hypothetical protein
VKILFAKILASTKNGQILFDRIPARKKGEILILAKRIFTFLPS